ncbi:MAG: DUF3127 domain-containing protein [Bacteroidales bacterium]|nr:MAG: DUF3127 domain-containing protein [Bacteroidales bacterium]
MPFELNGKIVEIFDTVQVSDTFRKREFIVEKRESTPGSEFTDYIKFQLTQDRCGLIDNIRLDEEVRISFNIRGNRWEREGKVSYFTNLDVWRIEKLQDEQAVHDPPPPAENDIPPPPEEFDDLPF